MRKLHKSVLLSLVSTALVLGLATEAHCAAQADPKKKPAAKKKQPKKNVVNWVKNVDTALTKAKGGDKGIILVFTVAKYKGPAVFQGKGLLKALNDSGATAVKIVPPPRLRIPKKATAEQRKKRQEAHAAKVKKHQELVTKYAVTATPKMVFLSPEGDAMWQLIRPTAPQVKQVLANLPKIIEQYKAAKAKAQGKEPPKEQPKPEEKKPEPKKPAPKKK
jgi:hypothetical protein